MKPTNRIERISRRLSLLAVLILLALIASPASAQSYSFSVDKMWMNVFVQPDASVRILYEIVFTNSTFGRTIDIVDIGMPTENYDIGNMTASLDGVVVTDIRPSEFVDPGVEIHLGGQSIPPGETGKLRFEFTIPDLVFQDVTNRELASLQITPTWFGDQFVQGTTDLQIAIHLPEGVSPDEVLYQDENTPFTTKAIFRDRVVVAWEFQDTRLTGPHLVGVSFPARVMQRVVEISLFELAVRWFEASKNLRVISGIIFVVLFSFLFLRFTGGTGVTLWLILTAGVVWLLVTNPTFHMLAFFPLIGLVIWNESSLRKRKKKYLPPIAQVEGGGIKRGLTAPEAAALLEMPLNKVLTLIIFGLLKKGVLVQVKDNPLTVEVAPEFRAKELSSLKERFERRRKAAQEKGIVLHKYEQRFLDAIEARPGRPVHKIDFSDAMKMFLRIVAQRMKGFDLSDTQDYYRRVVSRAWKQAQRIGEIPKREKFLDRYMEWVLMHEQYPTVFTSRRYTYMPVWIRPMSTGGHTFGRVAPSGGGGGRSSSGVPAPGFSDVAAGFAGWTENTMGRMAEAILPGKIQATGKSGVLDLSGFDKATGDFFEALAKSSGSGGGGGGCACACAGCACACACAGGGR